MLSPCPTSIICIDKLEFLSQPNKSGIIIIISGKSLFLTLNNLHSLNVYKFYTMGNIS